MLRCALATFVLSLVLTGSAVPVVTAQATTPAASLQLMARSRDKEGRLTEQPLSILPAKTAVVVVDMWDRHWCTTYTARVGNLVPRMNLTLDATRRLGVQVVFAPSDVVGFYRDYPQRKAMQAAPQQPEPKKINFDAPLRRAQPTAANADRTSRAAGNAAKRSGRVSTRD